MDDLDRWLTEAYPTAYRTACLVLRSPVDAQDAVQEAFLRVWRFRAALPDGDARRAWLYRVVLNSCLSRVRSERVWRGQTTQDAGAGRCFAAALDQLPDHLRVPVLLRYYSGLAEREIATAIRRRPATVRCRLSEARRRLAADPALAS